MKALSTIVALLLLPSCIGDVGDVGESEGGIATLPSRETDRNYSVTASDNGDPASLLTAHGVLPNGIEDVAFDLGSDGADGVRLSMLVANDAYGMSEFASVTVLADGTVSGDDLSLRGAGPFLPDLQGDLERYSDAGDGETEVGQGKRLRIGGLDMANIYLTCLSAFACYVTPFVLGCLGDAGNHRVQCLAGLDSLKSPAAPYPAAPYPAAPYPAAPYCEPPWIAPSSYSGTSSAGEVYGALFGPDGKLIADAVLEFTPLEYYAGFQAFQGRTKSNGSYRVFLSRQRHLVGVYWRGLCLISEQRAFVNGGGSVRYDWRIQQNDDGTYRLGRN